MIFRAPRPGDRLDPGPMPGWFKVSVAICVVGILAMWIDYIVNVSWIWRWLTGDVR